MPKTDRSRSLSLTAVAALSMAALLGLGLHAAGAISPVQAKDAAITIKDFAFTPAKVTVTAGSVVTWTNKGGTAHTVTSNSGSTLDSGSIGPGEAYGNLFDTPGTYAYHCEIHSSMKGTIVVTAAAPTPSQVGTPAPTPPAGTLPPGFRSPSPSPSAEPATTAPGPTASTGPSASPTTESTSSSGTYTTILLAAIVAALVVVAVTLVRRRRGPPSAPPSGPPTTPPR